MFTIEFAQEKDIEAICKIVSQMTPGLPHDYKEAVNKFKNTIKSNPDYFLWVARKDDLVVGTAMMHLQHKLSYNCGTAAHLEDVVVDKNHRGLGIGETLVKTAILKAKQHNCYKIMLTCWDKTVKYYEKLGFTKHDIGMKINLKENYPLNK